MRDSRFDWVTAIFGERIMIGSGNYLFLEDTVFIPLLSELLSMAVSSWSSLRNEQRAVFVMNGGTSYDLAMRRARCYGLRRLLDQTVEPTKHGIDTWISSDGLCI